MRVRALVAFFAVGVAVAACGIVLPGRPGWCGLPASGGPGRFQSGITPARSPTPDPDRLLCIAVENRSDVDFALVERSGGSGYGSALVASCSGMAVSQTLEDDWEAEVGVGSARGLSGPAAASFDASRLRGEGPFLVSVVIHPDRNASIRQVDALSPNPATTLC